MKNGAMGIKQMLFNLLYAVFAQCTDASNMQNSILLFFQTITRQRNAFSSFWRDTAFNKQTRPVITGWHGSIEVIAGIRFSGPSNWQGFCGFDFFAVMAQGKQAFLGTTHEPVQWR